MKRLPTFFSILALGGLLLGCGGDDDEPALGTTVYVDAKAAAGGDGSEQHPLRTVREALELKRSFDTIIIASGGYAVPASWSFASALTVTGANDSVTTLTAETADERIEWTASAPLSLSSLSFAAPFSFSDGELTLQSITVSGVTGPALKLTDATTTAKTLSVSAVTEIDGEVGTGDGVDVTGGSIDWDGGSVSATPDRALVLRTTTATLESLNLTSTDRAPLTVSAKATVTANSITIDKSRIAVFVDDASLVLSNATISNASTAGLLASADSKTTLTDSTLSDCPEGHVSVIAQGSSLTLERNKLLSAANNSCVSVAQTDGEVIIRDNVVNGCAGGGINLSALDGAVVEGNTIKNITPDPIFKEIADGISLLDASATVSKNTVSDTDGNAIALIRGYGTIEGNIIGPLESVGISVIEKAPQRALVKGNTIVKARAAGVLVLLAEADVENNNISETRFVSAEGLGDGIAFGQGADVKVTDNNVFDNATNGIVFLDGATGQISDNKLTENLLYGIREFCTGPTNTVTVGENMISGNGAGPTNLCSQ